MKIVVGLIFIVLVYGNVTPVIDSSWDNIPNGFLCTVNRTTKCDCTDYCPENLGNYFYISKRSAFPVAGVISHPYSIQQKFATMSFSYRFPHYDGGQFTVSWGSKRDLYSWVLYPSDEPNASDNFHYFTSQVQKTTNDTVMFTYSYDIYQASVLEIINLTWTFD